jgi:hypothetical protein
MGLLMDGIGNVLAEGQLVRVDIDGGGSVLGRISRIEQGGMHAVVAPGVDQKMAPGMVLVDVQVPTLAKPGSKVMAILVLKEPPQPRTDVQ